jgi:hypothetical protein
MIQKESRTVNTARFLSRSAWLVLPAATLIGLSAPQSSRPSAPASTSSVATGDTSPATAAPEDLRHALAKINAKAVRAHVQFLADDLLEGRLPGTRGYDVAARYVAAQLALLGLQPAGDGGTFFQQVPLLESRLDEATLSVRGATGDPQPLTWGEDFITSGDPNRTDARLEAPVVFAGFGISAPELSYDDYSGRDVRGKVVAVLSNAPSRFPSDQRAHHASTRRKAQLAADKGAVGLLLVRAPDDERRVPWAKLMTNPQTTTVAWVTADGTPADTPQSLQGFAVLSASGVSKLFAASPVKPEAIFAEAATGAPRGFDLGVAIVLTSRSTHARLSSANVVALIEGADPQLKKTSVVYSAHLDHIGVGGEVNGDRIYNGAYDNALGAAILIEAARALAGLPRRPLRSIAFVFVTAEEKGLVGSDYFAVTPPAAVGEIIANINVDMPLLLFPIDKVVAFGAEHSTLQATATRAAVLTGMTLIADPIPEETLFVRSDQYSFVRRGIPAVFLVPGFTSSDPSTDGPKVFGDFLARHYHMPSDDTRLPMDMPSVERFTRANAALAYLVASDREAPRWNQGDFFGTTFGRQK